jgi:replicative DNA helicase
MAEHPNNSSMADLDTERLVLATFLQYPDLADAGLNHGHFCLKKHQFLFEAIQALFSEGSGLDPVAVLRWLKTHKKEPLWEGVGELLEFRETFASPSKNLKRHIQTLKNLAQRRCLQKAALQLLQGLHDCEDGMAPLRAFESEVCRHMDDTPGQRFWTMTETVQETLEQIDRAYKGQTEIGIPTGLDSLDQLIGGLMPQDFLIWGGRPGMGKSAMATQTALHAGRAGYGVGILSLEMSRFDLALRMFGAMDPALPPAALRRGKVTTEGWRRLTEAASSLQTLPVYIADLVDCTIQTIRSKVRALMSDRTINLLIVDYVQLLRPDRPTASRELEVSAFSRGLKALAKELNIPVVALASLNRQCEGRPDKRPMLSDLRESGNLESDADIVLFFYRDEVYDDQSPDKGKAEILVRKNRHGAVGDLVVGFHGPSMTFHELAE